MATQYHFSASGVCPCPRCGEIKPLELFYKNSKTPAGRDLSKCKDCAKAAARKNRLENIDRIRAYDRDRGLRQPATYLREYRKENRDKYMAHSAISNAVRDGRMSKPDRCSHCHTVGLVEGHHPDYSKPLSVVWLCPACHKQLHALLRTVERVTV